MMMEGTALIITWLKRVWKNEYFKTLMTIGLVIAIVLGSWSALQIALNTRYPILAVASGSMCEMHGRCDGWNHPFERTLHVGDLIIVQGVNPKEIRAEPYPNGDIIVFRQSRGDELVVHRAIERYELNGRVFFRTKGDGNPSPDPELVPEGHVIGKVILRIPWAGHLALFMKGPLPGVFLIAFLIVTLSIVELIVTTSCKAKMQRASGARKDV